MKKSNSKPTGLSLVISPQEIESELLSKAKQAMMSLAVGLMQDDVERLCGKPFERKTGMLFHRGGSETGYFQLQGGKYGVKKPRVRGEDGEVQLSSYKNLSSTELLDDKMLDTMMGGVATRKYDNLINGFSERTGVSKSSVSRSFIKGSKKSLDQINSQDLSNFSFVAVSIDGVIYAKRTIIVALGIDSKGNKVVLGLREGNTENSELVKDLLIEIRDRGFTPAADKFLVCIDGSKALRKAINLVFSGQVVVQRCYLHKLRNLCEYVPKEYHQHLHRRMKKMMGLVEFKAALDELRSLLEWLSGISNEAKNSLQEAGEELLTVHKLRMPAKLRRSFASTNMIESLIGVVRSKPSRVKNWNNTVGQRSRWVAAAIMDHQKKKRRIHGYKELPLVIAQLNKSLENKNKEAYTS